VNCTFDSCYHSSDIKSHVLPPFAISQCASEAHHLWSVFDVEIHASFSSERRLLTEATVKLHVVTLYQSLSLHHLDVTAS